VQRGLLQQLWQYPQKTYDEIAAELGYSSSYIKKTISPELWKLLTSILGETVQKNNFRSVVQQRLKFLHHPQNKALIFQIKKRLESSKQSQSKTNIFCKKNQKI